MNGFKAKLGGLVFGLPGTNVIQVSDVEKLAAQGLIANVERVGKFGRNNEIANSAAEDVWTPGGSRTVLTAATTLEVKSTSENDIDVSGSGARQIRVYGLDTNWEEITEDFALNGSTFVAGSSSFLRVNSLRVISRGTYDGYNAGTITVRKSDGSGTGAILSEIAVDADFGGDGASYQTHYTVPADKGALVYYIAVNTESAKGMRLSANIRTNASENLTTAPFIGDINIRQFTYDDMDGYNQIDIPDLPFYLPPKTDVWFSAIAAATTGSASLNYGMLIFDIN